MSAPSVSEEESLWSQAGVERHSRNHAVFQHGSARTRSCEAVEIQLVRRHLPHPAESPSGATTAFPSAHGA